MVKIKDKKKKKNLSQEFKIFLKPAKIAYFIA